MPSSLPPFNLELLIPVKERLAAITPVTVPDIFEGSSTKNFHPNGLFSIEIFGKAGSEERSTTFSYLDLKVPVFHPILFKALSDMKALYVGLMSGTAYAVWDEELKDFIKCDPTEGDTGYNYFVSKFDDIVFEERESSKRTFNIELVNKYRSKGMYDKLLVLPAGLREYFVDETGKPTEDEVNTFYRKIMSLANMAYLPLLQHDPASLDSVRFEIQMACNNLYLYFESMIAGKKKLILGKWASRAIDNGTRNVITSLVNKVDSTDSLQAVDCNQTVVGMFQFMKAALPLVEFWIKNGFLSKVFPGPNSPAVLVNKKTLRKEMVDIAPKVFDEWMTDEGIEKLISKFAIKEIRHKAVVIDDHYIGLLYRSGTEFCLFQDIGELPDGYDKNCVKPVTLVELLYASIHREANTVPCLTTRYPVAGYGGIYPSFTFLKSTVRGDVLRELDGFRPTEFIAPWFPIPDGEFMESMSPAIENLARAGADEKCTEVYIPVLP